MERQTNYSFGRIVKQPYAKALPRVREVLAEEGFGILTEIDVRDKFAEKLDVDFRPYMILGACNPALAHRALSSEIGLGVLLPCNVVLWAEGDGETAVMAMDPARAMQMIDNPEVSEVAAEVRERLARALEKL